MDKNNKSKGINKIISMYIILAATLSLAAIISAIMFMTSGKLTEVIAWNEITCCKAVCLSAIICVCIICLTVITCLLISALKPNKTQSWDSGESLLEAYKEIFSKCKNDDAVNKCTNHNIDINLNINVTRNTPPTDDTST